MPALKSLQKINKPEEQQKGAGHRERLRHRFLQSGLDAFLDYEIVELLLTLGTPRRDCKQIAKEAIKKFKNLRGVLDTSPEDLQEVPGIGPSNIFGLKLFQAMAERHLREQVSTEIVFDSSKAVFDYLQRSIGREKKEHFVILSLSARNQLIKINNISVGTLNASLVHPREVFEPAIRNLAAQIILAHNHPSGNPQPSPEDIALTRRLGEASRIIGIELIDHIIVTTDKFVSMKEQNLL